MACRTKCWKNTVLVFNAILWLVGCVLLGIGIWVVSNSSSFTNEKNDLYFSWNLPYSRGISYETTLTILGSISIAMGVAIIIMGFIGCCGALRESPFFLILSLLSLFFIFICLLIVCILVFVYSEQIGDWLKNAMEDESQRQVQNGILGRAHRQFDKCCGIDDSDNGGGTCLATYPPMDECIAGSLNCEKGCFPPVWRALKALELGLGITLVICSFIALLGIIFSCCFICNDGEK